MAMNTPPNKEIRKSEYLARISHEIRTPLTSIIGYAEVMLSDPKLPPDAKQEYVEIIRDAGKRLSEFLDTYIESEVVETNKELDERHHEDVSLLSQLATERVSALALAKSVTITTRCEPAIFIERAQPNHLVHILENLLVNSIDLAPEGGHIEIAAMERPDFVEINVTNKDRGFLSISVSTVSKQFRWTQSPGIEIHHDGLGLAFAKHVVELEGGLLNIQAYEQGLTFTVHFPRNGNN